MDFRNEYDKHLIEKAIKAAPKEGAASPVGAITPEAIGQTFVDTAARVGYISVGLTNADWLVITP